jgi:hypothetical protein
MVASRSVEGDRNWKENQTKMPVVFGWRWCQRCILRRLETGIRRTEILNSKWLTTNEDVACKKVLRRTNKSLLADLGRSVDKVKCQWCTKIK